MILCRDNELRNDQSSRTTFREQLQNGRPGPARAYGELPYYVCEHAFGRHYSDCANVCLGVNVPRRCWRF